MHIQILCKCNSKSTSDSFSTSFTSLCYIDPEGTHTSLISDPALKDTPYTCFICTQDLVNGRKAHIDSFKTDMFWKFCSKRPCRHKKASCLVLLGNHRRYLFFPLGATYNFLSCFLFHELKRGLSQSLKFHLKLLFSAVLFSSSSSSSTSYTPFLLCLSDCFYPLVVQRLPSTHCAACSLWTHINRLHYIALITLHSCTQATTGVA